MPTSVHNLDRVVYFTHGTMILCVCLGKCCAMSEWRPLCWLGNQRNIMPFTRKEWKLGRPARDETSCSKDSLFFLMCLLDHSPGVVAIVGMPLHFLPYDHVRMDLDETPYPSFDNWYHINIFLFFLFYKVLSYLYINGGLALPKSRNGGRSLNISIEKYTLCSYSLIMIKEYYGNLKKPPW